MLNPSNSLTFACSTLNRSRNRRLGLLLSLPARCTSCEEDRIRRLGAAGAAVRRRRARSSNVRDFNGESASSYLLFSQVDESYIFQAAKMSRAYNTLLAGLMRRSVDFFPSSYVVEKFPEDLMNRPSLSSPGGLYRRWN